MTIVIRADANETTGTGHLSRTLALAEAFTETEIILAYKQAPSSILDRFKHLGSKLHQIESPPYGYRDATECNSLHGDWIIVDGYFFERSFFETLNTKTAALDDFARPEVMAAEVIINPDATAKPAWYGDQQTTLLGPSYVPLRKEFRETSIARNLKKVLLTTGGGDDLNITPKIIRKLRDIAELTVVVGPANIHRDELVQNFGKQVSLLEDVESMAEEIASSSLVICGAGSTIWECLALGTPLLPMILADNQISNHDFLISEGFAKSGGDARSTNFISTLHTSFLTYLNHPEAASQAAKKGQNLVDGRGALRIFENLMILSNPTNS